MNNLSSYCGLVDARISAPDKDLPVPLNQKDLQNAQNATEVFMRGKNIGNNHVLLI